MSDVSRLLLVDKSAAGSESSAPMPAIAADWTVDRATSAAAALAAIATRRYAAVLVTAGPDIEDPEGLVAAIRAGAGDDPLLPLFALTGDPGNDGAWKALGFDGRIALSASARTYATMLAPWRPPADDPRRAALRAMFGAEPLRELFESFAEQLTEAVAEMDAEGGAMRAHRIAGLAGTLGFPAVYEAWLPLSEGDAAAMPAARASARLALRTIRLERDRP